METPKIVTSAVIISNNKVLLIRRKKWPEENKLALPGGTGSLKKFPDPKEAIKDEVLYDLGVNFKIIKFWDYSSYSGLEGSMITLHFLGRIDKTPKPNKEAVLEWDYYSKEDFKKLSKEDFAFDHYQVLNRFFNSSELAL